MESTQAEAVSILDEIAHAMALPAVRTLASVLRSVLTRILDAIYVNVEGLQLVSSIQEAYVLSFMFLLACPNSY